MRVVLIALLLLSACSSNGAPWVQQKELITCQLPNNKWGRKEVVTKSRTIYKGDRPYRQVYVIKELSDCGAS